MTNVGLFFHTPFLPIFFAATKNRIGRGPLFFAATKNRIGRRPRGTAGTGTTPAAFYLGLCRLRGILSPPASATTNCRRAIFFYAATKNRIGRRPPGAAGTILQADHSPLRQRRIESDAEDCCHNGCCRRAIPHCSSDDAASIPKFTP